MRRPLTVMRSGSPGPEPTRETFIAASRGLGAGIWGLGLCVYSLQDSSRAAAQDFGAVRRSEEAQLHASRGLGAGIWGLGLCVYSLQDSSRSTAQEFGSERSADGFGVGDEAFGFGPDELGAVRRGNDSEEVKHSIVNCGVSPDGHLAASAEGSEESALGSDRGTGIGMVYDGAGFSSRTGRPGFNGESALSDRRAHDVGWQDFSNAVGPAEALESRGGEKDGVVLAFV